MLPRRAVVAIATTAIALVLLLNFKTPSAPILGSTPFAVGQPSAQAALAPTAAAGSSAGTGTAPAASSSPVQSSTSLKNGQYSGPVEQIPFGNVQVRVTIQGGKIVDVQALQLPTAQARSQQLGQYAAPILRQEALQAQSAQINLVSGATYTSEAYAQSLQGALDQATA